MAWRWAVESGVNGSSRVGSMASNVARPTRYGPVGLGRRIAPESFASGRLGVGISRTMGARAAQAPANARSRNAVYGVSFTRMLDSHISNTVEARHNCAHVKRRGVFLVADMAASLQFPSRTRLRQDVLQLVFVPFEQGDERLRLGGARAGQMREHRSGAKCILERRTQRATSPEIGRASCRE